MDINSWHVLGNFAMLKIWKLVIAGHLKRLPGFPKSLPGLTKSQSGSEKSTWFPKTPTRFYKKAYLVSKEMIGFTENFFVSMM